VTGITQETSSVYEAAGGEAGVRALAQAWHERVLVDEVVGHAFSHGFDPHHTDRLAAYLGEALGGPPTFSTQHGDESAVVRMHSGNGAHDDMDDRAVACFDQALDDVGIGLGTRLGGVLHDYFAWATRTTMNRYPDSPDDVPDGLAIPRWSWDGLVIA
jgi:hemoglobin